jgi:hypothetical protein
MGGTCGLAGQACCGPDVRCTAAFLRCDRNGNCVSCGGLNQRCCEGGACAQPYACDMNNMCAPCGGTGQRCCAGELCATGRCNGGQCP